MPDIAIIGAGFAGVWAAAAAARVRGEADLDITLVAPTDQLVLRPRLYEPEPELATVDLKRLLEPIGVRHVREAVTGVDTGNRTLTVGDDVLDYRRLVLAAGSELVRPAVSGAEGLHDVDTFAGATKLADHLRDRDDVTVVVVGAGFVGIELATELASRGRVVLVERAGVVGPELGPGPRPPIEAALAALRVDVRLRTTLTAVDDGDAVLSDGSRITADAVVWATGMRASPLTAQVPGERDELGRLRTDGFLRAAGEVFAAGDVAAAPYDAGHLVLQCCQHAVPMGKVAGHNAAADLLGRPLRDFAPGPYLTCLDLGDAGGLLTRGWERRVVASGEEGKRIKKFLMERIQPPVDDAGLLLMGSDQVWLHVPDSLPA